MDPIANMALSANGTEVSFPGWARKGVGALGGGRYGGAQCDDECGGADGVVYGAEF
jgi:hypothetical protein